jgi:hypothetical protein
MPFTLQRFNPFNHLTHFTRPSLQRDQHQDESFAFLQAGQVRVQGSGFGVQGSGFGVPGSGFAAAGFEFFCGWGLLRTRASALLGTRIDEGRKLDTF